MAEEITRTVEGHDWWHTIEVGDGIVTRGGAPRPGRDRPGPGHLSRFYRSGTAGSPDCHSPGRYRRPGSVAT